MSSMLDTPQAQDKRQPISREAARAWAAGFIDGDGCISIARQKYPGRKNPTYRAFLAVTQNHRPSLRRLCEILGVRTKIRAAKRQPYHRRQVWFVMYFGPAAMRALEKVEPYLVRKWEEVQILKRLSTEGDVHRYPGPKGFPKETWELRHALYEQIKSLH